MADLLSGISPDDIVRVELASVIIEGGRPSCATAGVVRIYLSSGEPVLRDLTLSPTMYETLLDQVAALNAMLRRRRMR